MRIVVYPHDMELGGSQMNAVELAGQYSRDGHEVTVFSPPGVLVERVHQLGLRSEIIVPRRMYPSPGTAWQLRQLLALRRIEAVHAFEWPPILTAWAAAGSRRGTAVLGTIMSMSVAPLIPRDVPITAGTGDIVQSALELGFRRVELLEPPIDTQYNSVEQLQAVGGSVGPSPIPGPVAGLVELVMVTRLVPELKGSGLREAIAAMADLPGARLLVVGDGPLRAELEGLAAGVNLRAGRQAALLVGEMADPRPAYARADVVLGMGGSALRGLAFGKPVVVAGEAGFWQLATPQTAAGFSQTGWFGVGSGGIGVAHLTAILRNLIADQDCRAELGAFGRQWVVDHYGLGAAAQACETLMRELQAAAPAARTIDLPQAASAAARLGSYKLKRRQERRAGTARADDFNAVVPSPVTAQAQTLESEDE